VGRLASVQSALIFRARLHTHEQKTDFSMAMPAVAQLLSGSEGPAPVRSELDWVHAVQSGLPASFVSAVIAEFDFSPAEIEQLVIPRRTLAHRRAKNQPLSREESVRLARIARVALEARDTFGDAGKAHEWLRRPNRALRNSVPMSLLDTDDGARLVEVILGRLAHGLFS
jgi:putative toxin-antitoxin system antitoxin component (TIGR02293 family)